MNEKPNVPQWTEEDVSKLYDLKYRAKLTNQAIADYLHVSLASVKGKLRRMKSTFKQWSRADKSKKKSTIKGENNGTLD